MKVSLLLSVVAALVELSAAYDYHSQFHNQKPVFKSQGEPTLEETWGQDWLFDNSGASFAHLPNTKCLIDTEAEYDIGLIGVPFDTAVSYRPGSRFGPQAIRQASQRQSKLRGFNFRAGINPYTLSPYLLDCGDVPVSPMDNMLALKQMTLAFGQLYNRTSATTSSKPPKYIALGGDHSIILPHLRGAAQHHGKLSVIHFDAHLDTWLPDKYPSFWHSDQSEFTHGSMLWMAHEEKLISDSENLHVGIRTRLGGDDWEDYMEDDSQGFKRIDADEVWLKGVDYVVETILSRISEDSPVFISVDIDVLDPGFAPGTGTIEPGGLLPRELIHILRRIEHLNIVGADIVEVSPSYDNAEVTSTNAAQVVFELITSMTKKNLGKTVSPLLSKNNMIEAKTQQVLNAAKNMINNY